MEHSGDADARTEVLAIAGDDEHRLRRRLEQQIIDQRLVLVGDLRDLGGQREHDMEVTHGEQVSFPFGQPCARGSALTLGTMPVAAAVVRDPPMPAVLTCLDMAAKGCGAAVLDRRHHLELVQTQMPGMGVPVCWSGGTEDIGDLERGAHRLSRAGIRVVPCLPSAR